MCEETRFGLRPGVQKRVCGMEVALPGGALEEWEDIGKVSRRQIVPMKNGLVQLKYHLI